VIATIVFPFTFTKIPICVFRYCISPFRRFDASYSIVKIDGRSDVSWEPQRPTRAAGSIKYLPVNDSIYLFNPTFQCEKEMPRRRRSASSSGENDVHPSKRARTTTEPANGRRRRRDSDEGDLPQAKRHPPASAAATNPPTPAPPAFVPYAAAFAAVQARLQAKYRAVESKLLPLPLWQQQHNVAANIAQQNQGDERFAAVWRTLFEFTDASGELIVPSDAQQMFLRGFWNATARKIYGSAFDFAAERILTQNNWTEFRQEVFVVAARNDGKTYALALFFASLLINCPGIRTAVFGHSQRGSSMVLEIIQQLLLSHPRGRTMIYRMSSERIELRGESELDLRVCFGLPQNETTTRGTQVDVVAVDEMAFVREELLMGTLIPMLMKKNTCILGISTAQGDDNIYTWLIRLLDKTKTPPQPLFNVIQAGRVCPACVDAGRALECRHMNFAVPSWKSATKIARMEPLYEDNPHLMIREIMGGVANSDKKAFRTEEVRALFTNISRDIRSENVKCVYLAADPSGGGPSEFAVVAAVEDGHRLSVRLFIFV